MSPELVVACWVECNDGEENDCVLWVKPAGDAYIFPREHASQMAPDNQTRSIIQVVRTLHPKNTQDHHPGSILYT